MIQTINFSQFTDSFSDTYKDNFSYEGKRALFDYLEDLETGTGEQIELDPIALCCEWSEYDNLTDALESYTTLKTLEDLEDNTQVIKIEGTNRLIVQDF